MATVEVPTTSIHERYKQQVELESENFIMRIRYNKRAQAWFVDLFDTDNNAIVFGRRAVIDWPIYQQFRHLATPNGFTKFVDTTNTKVEAGRNELGTRVVMLYTDRDDIVNLTVDQLIEALS